MIQWQNSMIENEFTRLSYLIGKENTENLKNKRIAVFGIGGVGGYVCEALVRCGIEHFDLFDNDVVSVSNINRQIIALNNTIGMQKTQVMKERMLNINKNVKVNCHNIFYLPENADSINLKEYDYVVDAIDTVSAKIELVVRCTKDNIKIISAMGAGNKLNPAMFEVSDIYKTSMCPLARVMRHELKKRNIKKLKVVYSKEKAITPVYNDDIKNKKLPPGSCSFVPSVCGLIIASEVFKDLM